MKTRVLVHTILTVGGSLILGFAWGYYYAAADLSAVILEGLK